MVITVCDVEKALEKAVEGIVFSENPHSYTRNGETLPSVTEILRPFYMQKYSGAPDNKLDSAASKGTRIHEAIAMYAGFGWEDQDPEVAGYIAAYKAFREIMGPDYHRIGGEVVLGEKDGFFAGTADEVGVFWAEDGSCTVVIVDFKTGSQTAWPLWSLQLSGYAYALAGHLPLHKPCEMKLIGLHLRPDGSFEKRVFQREFALFKSAYTLWAYINGGI